MTVSQTVTNEWASEFAARYYYCMKLAQSLAFRFVSAIIGVALPSALVRTQACVAVFAFAALLCVAPAHGQAGNKRCITVDEPFYKIHRLKVTSEVKPIKHCYSAKDHPYRYSVVDIPVSLAIGTIRTPQFSPPSSGYWILLQVEKPLPTQQMACMMAVDDDSPQSWKRCPIGDRLLRADWTVWEDGKIAFSGSSTTDDDAKYTRDNIFKFLGKFPAQSGKEYVLEVKFTKDGTRLNAGNPHLIITKIGNE